MIIRFYHILASRSEILFPTAKWIKIRVAGLAGGMACDLDSTYLKVSPQLTPWSPGLDLQTVTTHSQKAPRYDRRGLGQSFLPRNLFQFHISLSQTREDTPVEFSWKFFGVVFWTLKFPL